MLVPLPAAATLRRELVTGLACVAPPRSRVSAAVPAAPSAWAPSSSSATLQPCLGGAAPPRPAARTYITISLGAAGSTRTPPTPSLSSDMRARRRRRSLPRTRGRLRSMYVLVTWLAVAQRRCVVGPVGRAVLAPPLLIASRVVLSLSVGRASLAPPPVLCREACLRARVFAAVRVGTVRTRTRREAHSGKEGGGQEPRLAGYRGGAARSIR